MGKYLLLILCYFLVLSLQAQQQPFYETLTEKDGLSDNRVTCFLKDKTGYLWVGTRNGLNRYNGYNFTVFYPRVNELSNEVINDLAEDKNGKIWVATANGLNRYDPVTKQWFTFYAKGTDSSTFILNPNVWSCYVDDNNEIWMAPDGRGLSVYSSRTQKLRHYPWRKVVNTLLPQYYNRYCSVIKIIAKNKNEFWLGTTLGLFSFNKLSGKYTLIGTGYYGDFIDLAYDQQNRKVYLTAAEEKLFCYDEQLNEYKQLQPAELPYPSRFFSTPADHYIWLGTENGMLFIEPGTKNTFLQKHIPHLSSSLAEGSVQTIYHDATGISWVASNNGIVKFDRNSQQSSFLPLLAVTYQVSNNPMGGVYYDKRSQRYFVCSSDSTAVFIISRETGTIQKIRVDHKGKQLDRCYNVCADRAGRIWLLTKNAVYSFNEQTNKFEIFPIPSVGTGISFRDMAQDERGNYWFSSFHGKLYYYDASLKKYIIPGNDSIRFKGIVASTALLSDTVNHCVWIGTFSHGIYKYDLLTNKFTLYSETSDAPDYTDLNLVNDIEQDASGRIWVATHTGGLYYSNKGKPISKFFTRLSMKDGLVSNNIYALSYGDSLLWVTSGKHISAINTYSMKVLPPFSREEMFSFSSFSSDEIIPHYTAYDHERKELLVGVGGGLLFLRNKGSMPQQQFPLVLSSLKVNDVLYTDSIFKDNNHLSFSSPVRQIVFNFSALQFSLPSLNRYEYMLEGYDNKWEEAVNINSLNYQNLPPKNYRFRLRAKSHAGTASLKEAVFSFTVDPFFWQTWWFRLLCLLAVAAIVYGIYRYQLNKKLEVERLRHRISRDLHDDIGSALTTINVLSKVALNKGDDQKSIEGYLTRIKDSAQQTMESMSDIVWAINPTNDSLESMLVRMKEYAAELCEARAIELAFEADENMMSRKLDVAYRKNVFLIFKEAVNNAVKYSNCEKLLITLAMLPDHKLHLSVKDNGKGFADVKKNTGNGLQNMQSRAKELGGVLLVNTATGKGTTIELFLPNT
ncbi:sensor histidine kinase [Lacibacter sediminis]|uniref:Histidine kinase domain-containing protein n=1 Tax=Lacibacter sediminis TaxID=2760713 RepID=A0A7G5XCT8_9BACT|nr:sensor histidine kinase [Lacibacter sediminis]QNA43291.1 hypothetical protein H4075_14530 [Lacibacter sediminis]